MVVGCYQRANGLGITPPGPDQAQLASTKSLVVFQWKRPVQFRKTQLNYRLKPLRWTIQNALTSSNKMQMEGHCERNPGFIQWRVGLRSKVSFRG